LKESVREFVSICAGAVPAPDPVYEFGSFQVEGQEAIADLRAFFPGRAYVGCDVRPGRGVDKIMDVMAIPLPDESVGTLIFVETLEHVPDPFRAMAETRRVLAPRGILIMSTCMIFHIHDKPIDYWRFCPDGIRLLLKGYGKVVLETLGAHPKMPHSIMALASKDPGLDTAALERSLAQWKRKNSRPVYNLKT
jgi:SAM-dependent methyltransferase